MSDMDRRAFLGRLAAGGSILAAAGLPSPASADIPGHPRGGIVDKHRKAQSDLAEPAFRPLPLGSVRPRGWLQRQLRLQAEGLSGHLDEFWPDVGESQWFGGDAEGWERAPYWMDGFIPLAWVLDDDRLKAKATRYVEEILARQRSDGWYSPYPTDASSRPYDHWAILLANKMMVQYHEATGDDRVLHAVEASLRALATGLARDPLFRWGRYRWFEGLIPAFYLYERTGAEWVLELARTLRDQGMDYQALWRGEDVTVPTPRRGLWKWDKHVVNTAMAPKSGALSWRLDQRGVDREFPARMLATLDRHHGQVNGMFTGDECLAGKNPVQGTELCAVVEFMYSLEILLSVFGEPIWGDRLERVAFNALPATFTPDMWAHQYDQQVNQIQCTINPDHMWTTNGAESNLYGLEPNFGCCTSNMHQGWPKFAANLWMGAPDGGIAAVAYAPSEARFRSGEVPVRVTLDTDYPFRESLELAVALDDSARFPLFLRVPGWAVEPAVRVEGGPEEPMTPGTFHRIERDWQGVTRLSLRFPMQPSVTLRYNRAAALERGPLVYALAPEESWTRVNVDEPHRELPHGDFEVRPATTWNYGVLLDDRAPEERVAFREMPVGERPFSPEGAGMVATLRGRKLPGWRMTHGWAGEVAPELQESEEPLQELTLIPYGCTNIRVTEFPRLRK
ncbi:MAG: glycoside hydrolase family 127 protein [Gemmatimonadota bacterium]